MTMSPRNRGARREARGASPGKLRTSVALSRRRKCALNLRIRASETMAMATSPRAGAGATRASQAARPGARTGRPWPSVTSTLIRVLRVFRGRVFRGRVVRGLLPGSTERFVRLHDLLDKRVAHHVLVVEVHDRDPLPVPPALHPFHNPPRAPAPHIHPRPLPPPHP